MPSRGAAGAPYLRELSRRTPLSREREREIGGRLGLSAERVRQLEQRALGKLAAAAGAA